MNRENKRKTFEKGYYKTHACKGYLHLQGLRPALHAAERRQRPPQPLPELPFQPARRHRARRPGVRLRRHHGASGCLGAQRRRMGYHPPLQALRALSSNRVAADDNPMKLMSIAMKPLCEPPFPLDRIEEMTALMGGDGRLR